jgi:hypothetical protein
MIDAVVDVLIYSCTIPAVAFPAVYARFPWRTNPVGKSVMQLATSLALVLLLVVATTLLGNDYPGRDIVRLAVYSFLVVSLWRQLFTLLRVQRSRQAEIDRVRDSVLEDK